MDTYSKKIAEYLLQIKAIKLQPSNPFTWASGWKSPVYTDNRKTLSFPEVRKYIRDAFVMMINEHYPDAELIAGVATGAISHGALVADRLELPFVYVRSGAKGHGLGNQIEGFYEEGQKTVVIEDLISTGSSSLNAVRTLRDAGCQVLGLAAIFTYEFKKSEDAFIAENCRLDTLTSYTTLIRTALETGHISEDMMETLRNWRLDPENWGRN
ncbi:MAG: orotate phosphoribosyltransferase [Bacteroidales bacterium]|jgi:orotate phosphoribosyltransferase|nr:orotate phosphoribosyltransferase [Bacteroidales bacterium]